MLEFQNQNQSRWMARAHSAKPALCKHGLAASVKQALWWWPPVAMGLKHLTQAGSTSAVSPVWLWGAQGSERTDLGPGAASEGTLIGDLSMGPLRVPQVAVGHFPHCFRTVGWRRWL